MAKRQRPGEAVDLVDDNHVDLAGATPGAGSGSLAPPPTRATAANVKDLADALSTEAERLHTQVRQFLSDVQAA
jgi:hypothetical protein